MLATCALNLAAFVGGAASPRLDLISSFAPALLAAGLVGWALARAAGARRLAALALLGAAAPPAAVMAQGGLAAVGPPAPPDAPTLKVLVFNLWSGNSELAAVERLVRREQPDIVLLQEANGKGHDALMSRLSEVYPTNVSRDAACSTRVLALYPLRERVVGEGCTMAGARLVLPSALGGGELFVASIHLQNQRPFGASDAAARELGEDMARWARTSAIVGGDFNATSWSWALRRLDSANGLSRRTHGVPTWPAPAPGGARLAPPVALLPIDHLFATSDWATVRVRRAPATGSDHHPVIVELSRRSPPSSGGRRFE